MSKVRVRHYQQKQWRPAGWGLIRWVSQKRWCRNARKHFACPLRPEAACRSCGQTPPPAPPAASSRPSAAPCDSPSAPGAPLSAPGCAHQKYSHTLHRITPDIVTVGLWPRRFPWKENTLTFPRVSHWIPCLHFHSSRTKSIPATLSCSALLITLA